ncbi:30S ribosomal protein S6 [Lactobacillus acetotolerans DSM 20749 = JCM 3825]|nr:30S ribosomal protein S6 [Lactobacillus acetotolerans DSM 20749 = JCM 3825]
MLKLKTASNIFRYSLFLFWQEPFSPEGGAIVMATTKYEITYIIKPDVDEESKKAIVDKYDKVIADNDGTMVESKDWGKRHFAYEIDKYREGVYHIMTFTADNAKAVNEFDRLSKIDNAVLRSMTVKLDK